MASITCGNCHKTHSSSAEVRSCYGTPAAGQTAARTAEAVRAEPAGLAPDLLRKVGDLELLAAITEALAGMPSERHARVLVLRLGVADSPPLRLQTIGRELGVSRERVRQLEEKAVPRLVQSLKGSEAGQRALNGATDVIAPAERGWEDRVIALAHLLLPDAAPSISRRVVMALSGVKASPAARKAVRDRRAKEVRHEKSSVEEASPVVSREEGPLDDSDERRRDAPANTAGTCTVAEAVFARFGIRAEGGPGRFSRPGWFHVGPTAADCPRCGVVLEGFRAPYRTSAGVGYHYWALACLKCAHLWTPTELGDDLRHSLYQSSEHRPSAETSGNPSEPG